MSSADTSDSGMFKMMGYVILALTVFTLTVMLLARTLGGQGVDPTDTLMRNALIERIAPVGKVRTAAMAEAEGLAVAETVVASSEPRTGEELYAGNCANCHNAGVAGAPIFGDDAAWSQRNAAGLEALVASAIAGKGAMPAGGGSGYSDEEMTRAVKHLTGLE